MNNALRTFQIPAETGVLYPGAFFKAERRYTNKLGTEIYVMPDGRFLDLREVERYAGNGVYRLFADASCRRGRPVR